ncbi:hypothetical protein EYF80_040942 [Liparis tanakae]|uniref:Uncharacterized protein n=1 Tax=Liparis tanakae TaxID=230148 RepID=A0A4Z2G5L1_9TELE|nr:hypothetical protein EYF80_040942 [Liparis tanakae]
MEEAYCSLSSPLPPFLLDVSELGKKSPRTLSVAQLCCFDLHRGRSIEQRSAPLAFDSFPGDPPVASRAGRSGAEAGPVLSDCMLSRV